MTDRPREWWIFKGTSKLCDELVPSYDCESLVKCKHEGFYDLISPMDSIEGATHVIEYSAYESLLLVACEMREALEKLKEDLHCCWDRCDGENDKGKAIISKALQSFNEWNSGEKK